ncbi:hypothetical protein AG1IA_00509 [Rhizoctonia solani AG-1 IA]|uniref:Uncharacterized protein n=1 Tax=Thanatephorus cucumeris (strain AG1-IA) TaxID=983506 RepID=L8X5H7_THACA|nr:hypothetical protein AG1IA_00509 [Rhizoctonia solani AG-1 IA]
MSMHWNNLVPSQLEGDGYLGEILYEDLIEHDGVDAQSLHALASDMFDMTPKQERDLAHAYTHHTHTKYDSATPPLSPSTTISSLPTEEHDSLDEPELLISREDVKRGKQPELEEIQLEEYVQDDSDWYGMEYALEQSRYDHPGLASVWPPSAGESSTVSLVLWVYVRASLIYAGFQVGCRIYRNVRWVYLPRGCYVLLGRKNAVAIVPLRMPSTPERIIMQLMFGGRSLNIKSVRLDVLVSVFEKNVLPV